MGLFKCFLVPTMWRFSLCLLLLSFFAQAASAEQYYWAYRTNPTLQRYWAPSPTESCQKFVNYTWPNSTVVRIIFNTPTDVQCFANRSGYQPTPSGEYSVPVRRYGDSCPAGGTYNSSTGKCDQPEVDKCESSAGQEVMHEHKVGTVTGQTADNLPIAICDNACQATYIDNQNRGCRRENGGTDYALCKFAYKKNGVSCTSSTDPQTGTSVFDQPPTKAPSEIKPEYSKEDSCDKWVTAADGTASRKCTSSEVYDNPGKLDCTTSAASISCAPGTPPPAYNEKEVKQDEVKTTNPDGSTKTETTKQTTTKNCHGTKPCKSDSNTTKETSNTNADGTPGDKSTECKGGKCTTDPSKETDPSADPDKEEEEGEESSVTGGATCDAAPVCKGDAIQCAILRQQHTQRCSDEEFRDMSADKVNDLKQGLEGEFSGDEYKPITATSENTYSLEGMIDTSSRFSSSCPALPTVSYSWVDGSTQRFDPNVSGLCDYLRWMGYLIVAFGMRRAAEIIARGL